MRFRRHREPATSMTQLALRQTMTFGVYGLTGRASDLGKH
jgi:hypothetical protein